MIKQVNKKYQTVSLNKAIPDSKTIIYQVGYDLKSSIIFYKWKTAVRQTTGLPSGEREDCD